MFRLALAFCLTLVVLGGNSKTGYYKLVEVDPSTKSQGTFSSPASFGFGSPPQSSKQPPRPQGGPVSPFPLSPAQSGDPWPSKPVQQQPQQPAENGNPWASQSTKTPKPSKPKEDETPKPYEFNYVAEGVDGSSSRQEQSDGNGKVTGSYSVMDSDGRIRTVKYVADAGGFRAKVITNEQGTESKNPADVVLESNAPAVEYPPEPVPSQQSQQGGSYEPHPIPSGGGGGYSQEPEPSGQGQKSTVKKFLLVPVDPSELTGQKSVGQPPSYRRYGQRFY